MLTQRWAGEIFADYNQFYLWDSGRTNQAPVDYTDEDVNRRIKTGDHVVVIQPERNFTVPVAIEIHDTEPTFVESEWDHIAEAVFTCRLARCRCMNVPVALSPTSRCHPDGIGFDRCTRSCQRWTASTAKISTAFRCGQHRKAP